LISRFLGGLSLFYTALSILLCMNFRFFGQFSIDIDTWSRLYIKAFNSYHLYTSLVVILYTYRYLVIFILTLYSFFCFQTKSRIHNWFQFDFRTQQTGCQTGQLNSELEYKRTSLRYLLTSMHEICVPVLLEFGAQFLDAFKTSIIFQCEL